MSLPAGYRIERITAEQASPLRHRVLITPAHGDDPIPEDRWPQTFHLGVLNDSDEVFCVATFTPQSRDGALSDCVVRLRGMATAPEAQGLGFGSALIDKVREELPAAYVELWAMARDSAMGFYDKLGFEVEPDGFLHVGRPHHIVTMEL